MTTKNTGGPAFPVIESIEHPDNSQMSQDVKSYGGMGLRDWFAGMALQGMYAGRSGTMQTDKEMLALDAQVAYDIADAMIAEREK